MISPFGWKVTRNIYQAVSFLIICLSIAFFTNRWNDVLCGIYPLKRQMVMNENIKDHHGHIDDVNDIGILSDKVVYIVIYVYETVYAGCLHCKNKRQGRHHRLSIWMKSHQNRKVSIIRGFIVWVLSVIPVFCVMITLIHLPCFLPVS